MKTVDAKIDFHNNELQDIIYHKNNVFRLFSFLLVTVIFAISILCCIVVHCPSVVTSKIIITSINKPVNIYAKTAGIITPILKDGEKVENGSVIAFFDNETNKKDIDSLKTIINIWLNGQMSTNEYMKIIEKFSSSDGFISNIPIKTKSLCQNDRNDEFTELNILQLTKEIQKEVKKWEDIHVISSPIKGSVQYINIDSSIQFVQNGLLMYTIIPDSLGGMIGKTLLASDEIGNLRSGMSCSISLDNYNMEDYGLINGIVKNVSKIPVDQYGRHMVTISFPRGLHTDFNKEIPNVPYLSGIVTFKYKDRHLGELITEPVKRILKL